MDEKLPRGNCALCGKEIPVRSIRDNKAHYCSRSHEVMGRRFARRYRGTGSGPADRPNLIEKTRRV